MRNQVPVCISCVDLTKTTRSTKIQNRMDLLLGGLAAGAAGAICNPFEVVKIRMQLQGELKARGQYAVHYRNVFHATYTIASKEGVLALQKGVTPFVCYQFMANTARLGLYQILVDKGWTRNTDGTVNGLRTLLCSMGCGALGGFICSPLFLVKTHLQSQANASIAVGHQHSHTGMIQALVSIYQQDGIRRGIWRGATSNVIRIAAASAGLILGFEKCHEACKEQLPGRKWMPLCLASFGAGFFMAASMAPFDVVATRFYNQGTDSSGRGLLYRNVGDTAAKILRQEGPLGFYKGFTACYFRTGPFSFLVLLFWDQLKQQHQNFKMKTAAAIAPLISENAAL